MKKIVSIVIMAIMAAGFVSCSSSQQACADTVGVVTVIQKGSGGGSSSSGGSKSAPSGGSKSSPSGGSKSSPSGGSKSSPAAKSPSQSKAASNSKPNSKPDSADVSKARSEAPKTVTRGGSYTSNVTGNTYIFHSNSYYMRPGYVWDIYDPYNPYNYWYYPTSPYYGMHYSMAGSCGAPAKEVQEQKENINITIDNDGKVVQAEDKNPQDPDLSKPVPEDTTSTTVAQ